MKTATVQLETPRVESPIRLTADGRALIEQKVREIDEVRLPELRDLLLDRDHDERDVAAFERLLAERDELQAILDSAEVIAPSASAKPKQLCLGMRARVALADGTRAWVRPVDPCEAHLDDERISKDSPLARAILGSCPGAVVPVEAPLGQWHCRVLAICPIEAA